MFRRKPRPLLSQAKPRRFPWFWLLAFVTSVGVFWVLPWRLGTPKVVVTGLPPAEETAARLKEREQGRPATSATPTITPDDARPATGTPPEPGSADPDPAPAEREPGAEAESTRDWESPR